MADKIEYGISVESITTGKTEFYWNDDANCNEVVKSYYGLPIVIQPQQRVVQNAPEEPVKEDTPIVDENNK